MTEQKKKQDYIRTGIFMTPEAHERLISICKKHDIRHGNLLEALITKLPEETVVSAALAFKEEKQKTRRLSKTLLSQLVKLDDETLQRLLKEAKQTKEDGTA